MKDETPDANVYHRRYELCLDLAAIVPRAKPLFLRLFSLAEAYAEKAAATKAASLQLSTSRTADAPNQRATRD